MFFLIARSVFARPRKLRVWNGAFSSWKNRVRKRKYSISFIILDPFVFMFFLFFVFFLAKIFEAA